MSLCTAAVTQALRRLEPSRIFAPATDADVAVFPSQRFLPGGLALVNNIDLCACGLGRHRRSRGCRDARHFATYLASEEVACLVRQGFGVVAGGIVTFCGVPVFARFDLETATATQFASPHARAPWATTGCPGLPPHISAAGEPKRRDERRPRP